MGKDCVMKILVTGGCGFIGSHITDLLVEQGHDVIIIDNLSTGRIENLNPKATLYQMDILSDDIETVFEKERPEVIYHEAAQIDIQKSIKDTVFDTKVNVLGTVHLLTVAAKFGIKKFIYASSAAVYGNPEYLPVDEKHRVAPISFYGISKHTPEHYIAVFADIYGFEYTVLRYANVYGIRQDPKGEGGVISIFTDRFLSGQTPIIFGDGEQTRDFIYVKDIASANVAALTHGNGEIINVSTNTQTSLNDLFIMMRNISGASVEVEYQSARVGDIVHSYLDNHKALSLLDWKPAYTVESGLKETIDYYRDNY